MDNGQWTMDNGQWTMGNGQWGYRSDRADPSRRGGRGLLCNQLTIIPFIFILNIEAPVIFID